jgi:hypothetical protein
MKGYGSDMERDTLSVLEGTLCLLQLNWSLKRPLACSRQITSEQRQLLRGEEIYSLILIV